MPSLLLPLALFVALPDHAGIASDSESPHAAAAALQQSSQLETLSDWVRAVREHQPGTPDEGAVRIGSWSRADLRALLPWIEALVELLSDPGKPSLERARRRFSGVELSQLRELASGARQNAAPNDVLKRAALLHADVVMLETTQHAPKEPPITNPRLARRPPPGVIVGRRHPDGRVAEPEEGAPTRVIVNTLDGEYTGMALSMLHWDVARMALHGVTPDPSGDTTVRQWYRAIAAYLLERGLFAEALPHLERARQIFSEDPGVQFDSGCVHEALSSPHIQHMARTAVLPGGFTIQVGTARANLQRAESYFRSAVKGDPDFVEARVRLGRVVSLQGRHEEATRELQNASAATDDPHLVYYVSLFLGDALQTLGRHAEARDAYARAAALFPRAQSPHLALAQLARSRHDPRAAVEAIQRVLQLPHVNEDEREDPWWTYHKGAGRNLTELIAALHAAFPERGAR